MKFSDKPLPGMDRIPTRPPVGQPQPIDLGFFISTHQYLRSIPEPSEPIKKAIAHLEIQLSNAICSLSFGIGPVPPSAAA